jgi:anaerobic dimethyl sulfoxide reductase subunit A
MQRIARAHGHGAIFCGNGSGTHGAINASFDLQMLLARFGGFTGGWSTTSWEGAHFAMEYTLGLNDEHGPSMYADGADSADFLNSRLVILWGWNPAHTHFGTTTKYYLQRAYESGIPMIHVDPVYTDSAAAWGGEWIPIKPGADAAVMLAMAWVILEEGLVDKAFVNRFTEGVPDYHAHLRGEHDGVRKDPRWAEVRSDVPAETIARLARRYATIKPANLVAGYAPGRSAFGEQFHRAAISLQALTGNIGRPGGGSAGHRVGKPLPYSTVIHEWWARFSRDIEMRDADIAVIKTTQLADAILEGRHVSPGRVGCYKPLPADIRMLYCCAWNPLNQLPNINKTRRALEKLDFIVVQDQRLTPTARYADIVLPACTMLEREDFVVAWNECEPHLIPLAKAVEPLGQSKPDYWIFDEIARRLKLEPMRLGKSPRAWLDNLLMLNGHASFAEVVRRGSLREQRVRPWVAFQQNIDQPEKYPFKTPSGRIEIRSRELGEMNFARTSYGRFIPSLPSYIENFEGPNASSPRFPLQLITTKVQYRCHSTFSGNPLLEELFRQEVWMHPRDAAMRALAEGDEVLVFNERGGVRLVARVTERIKPGVVMIYEGAWYRPDENGVDRGGNPNVLIHDEASPAGAYSYNTARVEVKAAT